MTNRLNLTLHCGANVIDDVDDLKKVPTPEPEYRTLKSGQEVVSYQPISHSRSLGYVHHGLRSAGWQVEQEVVALGRDGAHAFGMIQVSRVPDSDLITQLFQNAGTDGAYTTVVAWRNSHDKAFSLTIGAGRGTWVCDNLCFYAEIQMRRRHSRYIHRDMPGLVDRTMGKLLAGKVDDERRIQLYQETELREKDATELIVRAAESKIIGSQKIIPVLQSFRTPEHPDFGRGTMYTLQNAFTEHFKGYEVGGLPRRSMGLNYLLDTRAGFKSSLSEEDDAVDAEFEVVAN